MLAACVFPADPSRAVGADLALPNRHARLDTIDQRAARREGLSAMRRARGANDRRVADLERARPMHDGNDDAFELGLDFLDDSVHLANRHRRVGRVLERVHGATTALVAHDTDEHGKTPGARTTDARERLVD